MLCAVSILVHRMGAFGKVFLGLINVVAKPILSLSYSRTFFSNRAARAPRQIRHIRLASGRTFPLLRKFRIRLSPPHGGGGGHIFRLFVSASNILVA